MLGLWIAWVAIGFAAGRFEDKHEFTPAAFVAVATLFVFIPAWIGAGLGVIVGRRIAHPGAASRREGA